MSFSQTVLLGAIAGFTIYLGLPMGRLPQVSDRLRSFLSMLSTGILLFLLFDILRTLSQPIEAALQGATAHHPGALNLFITLLAVFVAGLGLGLLGLVAFEQRFIRFSQNATPVISPARLALMIATGLGFHNFSEGLAIGQSAGRGEVAFAALLIVGFGLHNATEGFGIVGPLAGTRPSWGFLGLAGLIGGGPTFLGTLIGYHLVSTTLFVLFLALAAGALIYVIGELFHAGRRAKSMAMWGLLAGFVFAYLTELMLIAAGV